MIRPARATVICSLLVAACATAPPHEVLPTASTTPSASSATERPEAGTPPAVTPFSTAAIGELPPAWIPVRIARRKKLTEYRIVPFEGAAALQAVADASASGLRHDVSVDLRDFPRMSWKWKVPAINSEANNSLSHVEDSPARVVVTFEGGRDRLPPEEQINYDLALALAGNELPYATIMYIWENHLPEGAIITHHFSSRVKMIVAGSGQKDLGTWHEERVNLLEDYRRAFGEEPPRVKAVGVMADSDNTGARTVAYFGDIRFHRP